MSVANLLICLVCTEHHCKDGAKEGCIMIALLVGLAGFLFMVATMGTASVVLMTTPPSEPTRLSLIRDLTSFNPVPSLPYKIRHDFDDKTQWRDTGEAGSTIEHDSKTYWFIKSPESWEQISHIYYKSNTQMTYLKYEREIRNEFADVMKSSDYSCSSHLLDTGEWTLDIEFKGKQNIHIKGWITNRMEAPLIVLTYINSRSTDTSDAWKERIHNAKLEYVQK